MQVAHLVGFGRERKTLHEARQQKPDAGLYREVVRTIDTSKRNVSLNSRSES